MKNKKKILVVDDDLDLSEYYSSLLQTMGYDVVGPVASGEEAVTLAETAHIDIAIVDIMIEGKIDGIQVSEILKNKHGIASIYLSSKSDDKTYSRAKKTEPLAYLLKPVNVRELQLGLDLALSKIEIKKKLEESEYHYRQAQQIGNIGSWSWDIVENRLHWTDQIYRIFGLKPQEFDATYEGFLSHIHPDDVDIVNHEVEKALAGDGPYEVQHRVIQKDGTVRDVVERGEVSFNDKAEPIKMQGTVQDITELHQAQKQVEHLAYFDITTNLPNRNLFFDRLEQSLALQRREDKKFAVLAIDLDGFKAVNDTYGHQVGDKLLKEVGDRMQSNIRDVDMIARTGGDEFMAIIWGITNYSAVEKVAQKLLTACSDTFQIDNAYIDISCSVGASVCPDHGVSEKDLIKLADQAMYKAKRAGKNAFNITDG